MGRALVALMCLLVGADVHAGTAEALAHVNQFAASIKAASPATRVVIPKYFESMQFP